MADTGIDAVHEEHEIRLTGVQVNRAVCFLQPLPFLVTHKNVAVHISALLESFQAASSSDQYANNTTPFMGLTLTLTAGSESVCFSMPTTREIDSALRVPVATSSIYNRRAVSSYSWLISRDKGKRHVRWRHRP